MIRIDEATGIAIHEGTGLTRDEANGKFLRGLRMMKDEPGTLKEKMPRYKAYINSLREILDEFHAFEKRGNRNPTEREREEDQAQAERERRNIARACEIRAALRKANGRKIRVDMLNDIEIIQHPETKTLYRFFNNGTVMVKPHREGKGQ